MDVIAGASYRVTASSAPLILGTEFGTERRSFHFRVERSTRISSHEDSGNLRSACDGKHRIV